MKPYSEMALDGSVTSYLHYIALGLAPGGFVESILLGNIGHAYERAHPNLFLTKDLGWAWRENVVANTVNVIREYLPHPPAMDSLQAIRQWIGHSGLYGLSDAGKAAFVLEHAVSESHIADSPVQSR